MTLLNKIKSIFFGNHAVVLMYHRVANIFIDPWQLAVSTDNFTNQLKVLKNEFNVIPLKDLVGQVANGRVQNKSISITFDDGYGDNYLNAYPLLKQYECPATFFIPTGFINQQTLFWWDVITQIFLSTYRLPEFLQIGKLYFKLDNNGQITNDEFNHHQRWKWPAPVPTQRCQIYLAVWEYVRPLNDDEIKTFISYLINWSQVDLHSDKESVPMNEQQLSALSSSALISLGSHTINHPALGSHLRPVQQVQLVDSRDRLLKSFRNYFNAVAYPYGNYNEATLDIMQNENFNAGFTTEEARINGTSDIYQLGRCQVKNWTGDDFKKHLNKWINN